MTTHIKHGVDCQKAPHSTGIGFAHPEDDDKPYYLDGIPYCGRCHEWMDSYDEMQVEAVVSTCTWKIDDHENWISECGEKHQFMNAGPRTNGYKFCPYCGKTMVEV